MRKAEVRGSKSRGEGGRIHCLEREVGLSVEKRSGGGESRNSAEPEGQGEGVRVGVDRAIMGRETELRRRWRGDRI